MSASKTALDRATSPLAKPPYQAQLMALFVSAYAPTKRALMQAWSAQDLPAQRLAVHKLRGSLAWLGQPALLAQAAAFEARLDAHQPLETAAFLAWLKDLDRLVEIQP